MMRKTLFFFLLSALPVWISAAQPQRSGVLLPYQSTSLDEQQRELKDQLQTHQRDQQKYRENISGTDKREPALKRHQENREKQERRSEIQKKGQQEGASEKVTLHRSLNEGLKEQRQNALPVRDVMTHGERKTTTLSRKETVPSANTPRRYERKQERCRIELHREDDWSFNQRTIGKAGLKEKLELLSRDRPQPKIEVVFGREVPAKRRQEVQHQLRQMGFREMEILPDAEPKREMPRLSSPAEQKSYHWWQPEWWVRPK